MTRKRFHQITSQYCDLTISLAGDFCLDRYLEIDPAKNEISIETGNTVYNVDRVRSQPGGAGTILSNLQALGVKKIIPTGFAGHDGEGYELINALQKHPSIDWTFNTFLQTRERQTFTYCKPVYCEPGKPPKELNRIDFKNWSPTPERITQKLTQGFSKGLEESSAVILLDQVDHPGTGVIQRELLEAARNAVAQYQVKTSLADSRKRIKDFSGLGIKVNKDEFANWNGLKKTSNLTSLAWLDIVSDFVPMIDNPFFISLADQGIVGTNGFDLFDCRPAVRPRGPIDVVGAGDCTTANLVTAMASGASAGEAMELAMAAASVVVHKLGTTGNATVEEIETTLFPEKNVANPDECIYQTGIAESLEFDD